LLHGQPQPHIDEFGLCLDDHPQSPHLLDRKWELAARCVGTWLNAHPDGKVEIALTEFDPSVEPDYLPLSNTAILVVAPGSHGKCLHHRQARRPSRTRVEHRTTAAGHW